MSRTDAHVPERVAVARTRNPAELAVGHVHYTRTGKRVSCLDEGAQHYVHMARWASREPHSRKGSQVAEKKSLVRQTLRQAALEFNTEGIVDDPVMPHPARNCLCQMCN